MKRLSRVLPAAIFFALPQHLPGALAEERIKGVIRGITVTHCDATIRGGCAGTLTLEQPADGKLVRLTIKVPLGTPISREGESILLHMLQGHTVVVTQDIERGPRAALAIEVVEPSFACPHSPDGSADPCQESVRC